MPDTNTKTPSQTSTFKCLESFASENEFVYTFNEDEDYNFKETVIMSENLFASSLNKIEKIEIISNSAWYIFEGDAPLFQAIIYTSRCQSKSTYYLDIRHCLYWISKHLHQSNNTLSPLLANYQMELKTNSTWHELYSDEHYLELWGHQINGESVSVIITRFIPDDTKQWRYSAIVYHAKLPFMVDSLDHFNRLRLEHAEENQPYILKTPSRMGKTGIFYWLSNRLDNKPTKFPGVDLKALSQERSIRADGAELYVMAYLMLRYNIIANQANKNMPDYDILAHHPLTHHSCKIQVKYRSNPRNGLKLKSLGFDFLIIVAPFSEEPAFTSNDDTGEVGSDFQKELLNRKIATWTVCIVNRETITEHYDEETQYLSKVWYTDYIQDWDSIIRHLENAPPSTQCLSSNC